MRIARIRSLGSVAVVGWNNVSFDMDRMLGMLVEGVCTIEVFQGMAEAEGWLEK